MDGKIKVWVNNVVSRWTHVLRVLDKIKINLTIYNLNLSKWRIWPFLMGWPTKERWYFFNGTEGVFSNFFPWMPNCCGLLLLDEVCSHSLLTLISFFCLKDFWKCCPHLYFAIYLLDTINLVLASCIPMKVLEHLYAPRVVKNYEIYDDNQLYYLFSCSNLIKESLLFCHIVH